ncbi:DNA (cytosine-5)-methyltransferase 1 [Paenochrobactrum gallinarii]|uniref:Cytosine-specific methyltransferase n=1 Tax=Paenochrobactrum gallinarii TaxID=643673 RepID=A0A841M1K5_9HYPH|nr:DNA (cytosine-5-)-methyltransferase [Paenochrobactrum gallinarii]MBB6262617.1 DNA (cytosine-5)-methyltransferase 1 [Paenochrobactrum gallinarii]
MSASTTIRTKREALQLTQKELAVRLGLEENGERTIRGWENGEHVPNTHMLLEIKKLTSSPRFPSSDNPTFKFIDLFAGIGGIRLPFQELGGECVFTSEWDKFAQKTYQANFGEKPSGDITQIPARDIPEHDVLLAGFPCQAFSQAGLRQGFSDTRGTMFFEIQRILAARRPAAFLLENVKQLRGHDKGRTLKTILDILSGRTVTNLPDDIPMSEEARASLSQSLNYEVSYEVLRAADFGVPQNRERIYIVGFNRDKLPDIDLKHFFSSLNKPGTAKLGSVLEDNRSVDPKYTISDRLYAGHKRRKEEHKAKGNGFGFSLFTKESPYCNTISARYYKDGSEILIDQSDIGKNPRKLTPKECVRIQGFPENYDLSAVSDAQLYKQFGNSVSVPVIRAIAQKLYKILQE